MFIHRSIVEVSNKIFFIQCESNKSNRSNIIYVKINPKKKKIITFFRLKFSRKSILEIC